MDFRVVYFKIQNLFLTWHHCSAAGVVRSRRLAPLAAVIYNRTIEPTERRKGGDTGGGGEG